MLLLSLPSLLIEKTREKIFRILAPLWSHTQITSLSKSERECQRLESENLLLRAEHGKLRAIIEQNSLMTAFQKELHNYIDDPVRYAESCFILGLLAQAVPAKVIYRDPASWANSLWINIGNQDNQHLKVPIIAKNSPVLVGKALIGVIDYVGQKQSRVRLITDSGLNPSVRAVRGYPQNVILLEHIDAVLRGLQNRNDLGLSAQDQQEISVRLVQLKERLFKPVQEWRLAKGILLGSITASWRGLGSNLKGCGFNYDFSDQEGPARDLRTGKVIGNSDMPPLPLLKVNDLLVTTGMDGLFPSGLPVAEITKIHVIKEGSYTYEIEAKPIIDHLEELHYVYIIPPLGFNLNDQPR